MTDYIAKVHGVFSNGEGWSTSRHITSSQDPATILTTWGNAWQAAWTDSTHGLEQFYNTGTKITEFEVAVLGSQMREISGPPPRGVNLPGTSSAKGLPTQISIVASWRSSAQKGKTAQGHQALPACTEDAVTNNKLDSGPQTQFSAAMNAIRQAIQADGSTFFLFNRFPTSTGVPAFTKTVVDQVSVRDKVGTQDRRYRKELATYI